MNALRASRCLLLVAAAAFSCAGSAQPGRVQELEAYRLQLHEQVVDGKLTGKEAEALYMQKRNQLMPPVGADKAQANPPAGEVVRSGRDTPELNCQTYPDGRTECR